MGAPRWSLQAGGACRAPCRPERPVHAARATYHTPAGEHVASVRVRDRCTGPAGDQSVTTASSCGGFPPSNRTSCSREDSILSNRRAVDGSLFNY
eukprot:scaffold2835_cov105-Isochrysis_galbana.AAC.14